MAKVDDIYNALLENEQLCQLVRQVDELTVMDYYGGKTFWYYAIKIYLRENEVPISNLRKIILLGVDGSAQNDLEKHIHLYFPDADIITYSKVWDEIDPCIINIDTPLVLHVATAMGNIAKDYINNTEESIPLRRLVEGTRLIYAAIVLGTEKTPEIVISSYSDPTYNSLEVDDTETLSSFCISKEKYIRQCQRELSPQSALVACIEEMKHGCESCNMVPNYGKTNLCPLAQHEVALMYRKEDNQASQNLAHQLDRLSARQGYIPADIQIADNLAEGCGCEKDEFAALSIYKRHALNGNAQCCDKIIELANKEESISNIVAIPWIIRQANAGDLDKAGLLAKIFAEGLHGVPVDTSYSTKWQNLLAESGDEKYIAELMTQAKERQMWKDALKWCRKLRDMDSYRFDSDEYSDIQQKYIQDIATTPIMQYIKGKSFIGRNAKDRDVELAELCMNKAAEAGYLTAQEFLCEEYYSGQNFVKDFKKSAYWGDQALMKGSKDVRFRLAWLYCGEGGVAPDYEKSHRLYKELAKEGNSAAMNNLGWMCEHGHFYTVNPKKAFEWYLKAAELGDNVAMRNVGFCYKDATGVDRDYSKALEWFSQAANNGSVDAMRQMAYFYKNGLGVDKDAQKVVEWYEKIIGTGDINGNVDLGHYYETVIKDYDKALLYYRQAAEIGNAVGQYDMGIMYQYGKGVTADVNTAIYWYRKAARQGYESAQDRLQELGINWSEKEE